MSTYQELKGLKVKYLSSDTSGDRIQEGEVFYNSSDFNLKSFVSTAAWHSSSPLGTARYDLVGCGTLTVGLTFGGRPPATGATEEYNGTAWTETGDLSKAQQLNSGCGTTTAALNSGGDPFPGSPFAGQSETFDGTAWTDQGALPVSLYAGLTFGTQGLALTVGGLPRSPDTNANMRHAMQWNGSAWSDTTESTVSRASGNGVGTATAGLAFGGYAPNNSPTESQADVTEEWVMGTELKTLASTNA